MWFGYLLTGTVLFATVAYGVHLRRKVRRSHGHLSARGSDDIAIASWPINLVVLFVAVASLIYAKVSFDSSEKTAADQLVASQGEQKTLDDLRDALADMVKLANDQQAVMSNNLEIAKAQQKALSQQLDLSKQQLGIEWPVTGASTPS